VKLAARRTLVHVVPLVMLWVAIGASTEGQEPRIWAGVYTVDQAAHGQALFNSNCARCHLQDLSGDRGPALIGDAFFASWQAGSVNRLYMKIKDTMPPNNAAGALEDGEYLDIVAYILQSNAFPSSQDDVALTPDVLDDIQIARRDGIGALPNFALVQVVGCLTRDPDHHWTLTRSSQPVPTKDEPATTEELAQEAATPPGDATFDLLSVARFQPDTLEGRKLAARGLVYRSDDDSLLSLTSLQSVGPTCVN